MMKLTTWNIEHLAKPLAAMNQPDHKGRLQRISLQITEMDPDVLCLIEAPGNPLLIQEWVDKPTAEGGLNGAYQVAMIEGTAELLAAHPSNPREAIKKLYGMEGTSLTGNQWIWFLIKKAFYAAHFVKIQEPSIWYGLTGQKQWQVNYWGKMSSSKLSHWRHPQTLVLNLNGYEVEVIGVHLKSKINQMNPFDANKNLTEDYVAEALKARVKLATEAYDVRMYINQRFEQEANPRIIVCGDLNDGPGREFFERQFLFFDLISNIQGDVFFAKRFLNHALFDYEEHLRWSTEFNDRIERWALEHVQTYTLPDLPVDVTRKQLIDHILFTQEFVNRDSDGPKVKAKSGFVEHTIHAKTNASQPAKFKTSDHRPISLLVADGY
ncbi:MAG: hypothetical protein Q8K02_19040 [Flavobacterium sp.]|nr:hypothetical protein [Flavobacterium sp.]